MENEDYEDQDTPEPEAYGEELPDFLPEESMADEPEQGSNQDDDEPESEFPEESSESEEDFSAEPEEEEEKPKKRDRAQIRINQIQREKYQAQHQAQQLHAENERLRNMVDQATQLTLKQTEDSIKKRLEDAKRSKIAAIESYDANAQAEADVELAAAAGEMQYLNNWKTQKLLQEQQQQQQQQASQQQQQQIDPYELNEGTVQQWVEENEWFVPKSKSFDLEKSQDSNNYSVWLNEQLYARGEGHLIGSEKYFDILDERARQFDAHRQSQPRNPQGRRNLNMKAPKGGPSPSRSSHVTQANHGRRREITPTDDEKDMARRMGVTDKAYLKAKLAIEKTDRESGRYRGGR